MKKIAEYVPLTEEEIKKCGEEIEKNYEIYLKPLGIKQISKGTNKYYQLIYLTHFLGFLVHKNVITAFVKEHNPSAGDDQQVRHLGTQNGYNVYNKGEEILGERVPSGFHCLLNLTEAKPSWIIKNKARSKILNENTFEAVKDKFDYCCATCGAKEGEIHRYTQKIVKLQQGHMDPNKPLEIGNIIPQCEYCNQNIYKNDFVFTEEGRPKKINNPKYILKSDEEVQKEMYLLLKSKFE